MGSNSTVDNTEWGSQMKSVRKVYMCEFIYACMYMYVYVSVCLRACLHGSESVGVYGYACI